LQQKTLDAMNRRKEIEKELEESTKELDELKKSQVDLSVLQDYKQKLQEALKSQEYLQSQKDELVKRAEGWLKDKKAFETTIYQLKEDKLKYYTR